MKTEKTVVDEKSKITDEQIGKLYKKTNEIVRRVNEGTISYEDAIKVMQEIVIENKSAQHLDVVSGKALITYPENIIDCDANPFTPEGWKVESHKKGGQLKFDPAKLFLYLSKKQKKGTINGNDLRKELANQPVMNANVLDFLLAHPELIPEEWKGKYIFFWGTIYRDANGSVYVRCLGWNGSKWFWRCSWLGNDFGSVNPAALAS
jgi:hypothetical protein